MNKKIVLFAFVTLLLMGFASAVTSFTSSSARDVTYPTVRSLSSADVNTYWPIITESQNNLCQSRQDVLLQISPAGCQPTVVRSDILADQNVPVLCQLDALKLNPLLDIQSIDSMTFSGQYPKEVATTGFYPARAALSSNDRLLNNPILNNVGYVVVVLKRQPNESALPESVKLNLTARIRYDAQNALGVGQANFILPEQTEAQFMTGVRNSFWQGRYFVRADSLTPDRANIALYYEDRRISTLSVERGKQSGEIFVPGMSTCQASLKVAYDGFEQSGRDRARIEVQQNNQQIDAFDVYNGMSFYNGRCRVDNIFSNVDGTGSLSISCSGNDRVTLSTQLLTQSNAQKRDKAAQKEWDTYQAETRNAIEEYKKVATLYSAESDGTRTYGEVALQNALDLAGRASLDIEKAEILALYQKTYPDSSMMKFLVTEAQTAPKMNTVDASNTFRIDGKIIQVRVLKFIDAQASTVDIIVGSQTKSKNYKQGDSIDLSGDRKYTADVQSITADSVIIRPRACPNSNQLVTSETLREKQSITICGQRVTIQKINSDKLGTVRIIPNVNNVETVTNVSVAIGIEKRAIQLSPQRATEMISNLNKSIQKWESISSTLGKTVTGLKTACFATAAVLTAKNFVSGLDGTALARKNTMQGAGGWNEYCTSQFKSKQYVSVDACLNANSGKINSDVTAAQKAIAAQQNILEPIDSQYKKDTSTFGSVVDTKASANAYLNHIKSNYNSDPSIQSTVSLLDGESYNKNLISYDQMKELEYNALILKDPSISDVQRTQAQDKIKSLQASINVGLKDSQLAVQAKSSLASKYPTLQVDSFVPRTGITGQYEGLTYEKDTISGVSSEDNEKPFDMVTSNGERYIVMLSQPDTSGQRVIEKVYSFDGSTATPVSPNTDAGKTTIGSLKSTFPVFVQKNEASYKNNYLHPEVRYFETDPYKGMPSLVPVDVQEGWYAGTKQVLPVFGQQATFQSSGRVSSFWLCNVGSNGLEEFEKSNFGDDTCQQFNFYSGQPLNKFAGLSDSRTQDLVSRAVKALNDAAQQHASGVTKVSIGNRRYDVGSPSVNVPAVRCQDYMSPKECLLLFNVCDPVICPSSRCDFGGQYRVANVPETGIVGSALLCLPNAKEGIALPVCLTGLQSGVDGFVSVMRSHRDCLQEQLTTGRTVGICDQIYSIYMCEFFWRQAAPVANILLPKIVEGAYGQSAHGGGEYLTVMEAWKQTQQSVSYFTQQYAVNSIKAFQLRSVEEAGGEFCKAFASAKAPTSFKSLVEPDSPPQFHAWFSSIKYSDATVPATGQYKVYYHIFAGKDTGVTYQVYLQNPTGTSFYNVPGQIAVASGFITRGQYASQTRDFTAPEGYKELCVRVNDKTECGFQQVSTSFAVDYLTDQTRAETLKQTGITSSQGCVSGSIGTGVSLSPNLQTTAESVVTPQIYNQGIIRICATNDPGLSSAPGRFVKVGYCDNEKVGCWLDSESTGRAITQGNLGTQNDVNAALQNTQDANIVALQNDKILLTNSGFTTAYSNLKTTYTTLQSLPKTTEPEKSTFKQKAQQLIDQISSTDAQILYKNNNQKAQLQMLRAGVFEQRAETFRPVIKPGTVEAKTTVINSCQDAITALKGLSGKYGAHKTIVDQIYSRGQGVWITPKEYADIKGGSIINWEESISSVSIILEKNCGITFNDLYLMKPYDSTSEEHQKLLYNDRQSTANEGLNLKPTKIFFNKDKVYYLRESSTGFDSNLIIGEVDLKRIIKIDPMFLSTELDTGNYGMEGGFTELKILPLIDGKNIDSIHVLTDAQRNQLAISTSSSTSGTSSHLYCSQGTRQCVISNTPGANQDGCKIEGDPCVPPVYAFETITFGSEFLANIKTVCLIDSLGTASSVAGVSAGTGAALVNAITTEVANAPAAINPPLLVGADKNKIIVERGTETLVKYKGVWKSIPSSSKFAPYISKISVAMGGAGLGTTFALVGLEAWGAICSVTQIYLAVDEFNQMSIASEQAATSAAAYEAQLKTFASLPQSYLDKISASRTQLKSYSAPTNGDVATCVPSENEINTLVGKIDSVLAVQSLSANAKSIINVYNAFMTNTESTMTYTDPEAFTSNTVESVVDETTGSKISLEEGRRIAAYVRGGTINGKQIHGWYSLWVASGGKDVNEEAANMLNKINDCLSQQP